MLRYGLQIGVAGAGAAAIGLASGFDHPGWACTAALLVSRPDEGALHARSVGRAASVLLGALVACGLGALDPPSGVVAGLAAAALAGVCATVGSRWYVMPFFSTTIVLSMLVARGDEGTGHWFAERVGETLVGIVLALAAAWVASRLAPRRHAAPSS
ncbi:hypothetical protein GCM10025864_10520 [Luteimicrobium album]|uniref:Integral membrane bound transporter domain-containing protein n=1 Tax=Luteimicrobium album TaxID=1054550 RepID=A0ABQ6HXR0_9MICO|nr:FUSC family protein [Luteimicrobium album]GMA23293.1 hypothetical protein GCM10025864_10520 [Luteimicrobium album]